MSLQYAVEFKAIQINAATQFIEFYNLLNKMHLIKVIKFLMTLFIISNCVETDAKPTFNENVINVRENEIDNDNDRININKEYEQRATYAQKMKTFMNLTWDPCDDFYEYACGNWKNVIEKRHNHRKRNNLLDISLRLRDAVKNILSNSINDSAYLSEQKLAKKYYESCLSAELHPIKKSQVYLDVLKSIGGFPALDADWSAANFSWFNMTSYISQYDLSTLVSEVIVPEYPFPPYFELPTLGFGSVVNSYNIASNSSLTLQENKKAMSRILTAYELEEAKIEQVINDIVEFWQAVVNMRDEYDNDIMTCTNMSEILFDKPFELWNSYFDIAWGGTTFDEKLSECPCDYFYIRLDEICNKRKEAVANYLALKFLYKMHADLESMEFQEEYCVQTIYETLSFVIDAIYMQQYFNTDVQDEVTSILTKIRAVLRTTLQQADWLDEPTRKEALAKESTLILRVGRYEDKNITELILAEAQKLQFNSSSFEQNHVYLRRFAGNVSRFLGIHKDVISNVTKPLELMLGTQVNAFYYNDDNSINVMAGVLHPPTYHKTWPEALKYGTLGFLVGHEISHSTDSHYDSTGVFRNWWSKKTLKMYKERANCFVKHYDSYIIPEINRHLDGNITKEENIADASGLREALTAYRRDINNQFNQVTDAENKELLSEDMPGLDLQPEQLFFLGFAQLWCSAYAERHYWEELTMEHTIDKYRVLGAVTNNADFATAYNCPIGSKMNPKAAKCSLW